MQRGIVNLQCGFERVQNGVVNLHWSKTHLQWSYVNLQWSKTHLQWSSASVLCDLVNVQCGMADVLNGVANLRRGGAYFYSQVTAMLNLRANAGRRLTVFIFWEKLARHHESNRAQPDDSAQAVQ